MWRSRIRGGGGGGMVRRLSSDGVLSFPSQFTIKRYFEECQPSLYLWTNHIHVRTIIFTYILLGRSSDSGGINSRPSGSFERICNIQHPLAEETPRRMSLSPCPISGDAHSLYLNNRTRRLPPPPYPTLSSNELWRCRVRETVLSTHLRKALFYRGDMIFKRGLDEMPSILVGGGGAQQGSLDIGRFTSRVIRYI